MKTIILTLALCLSADLFAREIKLATITGNVDTDTSVFSIEVDDSHALDTVLFKTTTKEGKVTQDSHFPAETVDSTGVVLLERNNRDILRLETVKPFSFANGGMVTLKYLSNGATNSWKSLKVSLVKNGNDFEVRTADGKKVTRFYVKGNRQPVIGLVGIAELVPQP